MRHIKKIAILIVILFIALLLAGCQESDESKYKNAQSLLAKGEYTEAAKKYDELGSYAEASKLSMYCKAAAAGENGDYETAFSTFKLLEDYKDSKFMISYYQARQYESEAEVESRIQWGKLLSAAKMYDSLAVFRDSKERSESCRKRAYECAIEWAGSGKYKNAIDVLNALGQYSDSALLSQYYTGFYFEQNGDYVNASNIFSQLIGFKDSETQIEAVLERGYAKAESLEKDEKKEEAYKLYINLGEYLDSSERANKIMYEVGVTRRSNKDWEAAVEAFSVAGDYNDAEKQILITRYEEGMDKLEAGDWDGAREAFKQAEQYNDAPTQINEVTYQEASALEKSGNQEKAHELFVSLGKYSDSFERAKKPYYELGLVKRTEGKWDEAREAFALAGEYNDAKDQIRETYYMEAASCFERSEYKKAYTIYIKIQDYKDVKTLLASKKELLSVAEEQELARKPFRSVGNCVEFGHYPHTETGTDLIDIEWIVLDVQDNKVLLISKNGLDAVPFVESSYSSKSQENIWEKSYARRWLNESFIDTAFSTAEKNAIITSFVDNSQSQGSSEFKSKGYGETQDKVFLLSYAEVIKYLPSTADRICNATEYAKKRGAVPTISSNPKPWWLRSPGKASHCPMLVKEDGSFGENTYYLNYCVRPVLWLDLESDCF